MCFLGCGEDDFNDYIECCGGSISIINETPPQYSIICTNTIITVTFDNLPAEVSVSTGVVEIKGKTATITGPFVPGPLALTITWADGAQALNYTVDSTNPCD